MCSSIGGGKIKVFKSNKGFTLIEILVVISIIALLFILLLPQIESGVVRARETGVKTDFRSFQSSSELLLRESLGKDLTLDRLNTYLDYSHKIQEDGGNLYTDSEDPWGNSYKVEINGGKIVFYSHGKEEDESIKKYIFASYYKNGQVFSCTSGFNSNNIEMYISNVVCGDDLSDIVVVLPPDTSADETVALPTEMNGSCYVIRTIGQLQAIKEDLEGCYELGNDIDATNTINWNNGEGFEPIGVFLSSSFEGVLDGKNHSVNNIYINRNEMSVGVFAATINASIKNIKFNNASLTNTKNPLFLHPETGLFGVVRNSNFENIYVSATLRGKGATGGLAGSAGTSSFENIVTSITIHDTSIIIGGLVGEVMNETSFNEISSNFSIHNSLNSSIHIGGIYGIVNNTTTNFIIENSYSIGEIIANTNYTDSNIGGLIGDLSKTTISNSYSVVSINSSASKNGGLAGAGSGVVENSFWDSDVGFPTTSNNQGQGLNSALMKKQSTYIDWDFTNIWAINLGINDGYPYLRNNPPN